MDDREFNAVKNVLFQYKAAKTADEIQSLYKDKDEKESIIRRQRMILLSVVAGEEIGYIYDKPLEVSIPEGVSVSEGLKRMRLVMDVYGSPSPCGSYYFGETEDYGVLVCRNDNTPSVSTDLKEVSEVTDGDVRQSAVVLSNEGDAALEATIGVNYVLPEIYEPRSLAPANDFKTAVKSRKVEMADAATSPASRGRVCAALRRRL